MRLHSILGLLVGATVLTTFGEASADQFVLVDADYTHTTQSHAYGTPVGVGQPANWKTPVDYADGTAYYRLEVFEKPSTENLNMGICFEGGSYCCFGYERFTKPGVYEWSFAIPSMWQFDTMDWSKKITGVPLIMRDRNAVKVDSTEAYYGAPSTAWYFPMKSHTVTIVSKGATYVKPDAGSDGGSDGGDGGAGDATSTDTSPSKDAAVGDAGLADAASDAGAHDDAEADGGAPEGDTNEGSGCSTSPRGAGSSTAWIAVALSAWLVAQRRRTT